MASDRAHEIRDAGDTFVTRAAVILVLIHLLILPPLPQERRDMNQYFGNELRRVTDQRNLLEQDLASIEGSLRYTPPPGSKPEVTKTDTPASRRFRKSSSGEQYLRSDPTYKFKLDRDSLLNTRKYLLTTIEKNAEQIAILGKAKFVRELKIPGTESAIDESQVRVFYAVGLCSILLIVVFRYRNPLLSVLTKDSVPPVWAAPVPYGMYDLSVWQCTLLNVVWLSVIAASVRLFINSCVRREFFVSPALYTANIFAASLCLATYLVLLIRAVAKSKSKESAA